jgi:HAMP domain-containing protein
MSDQPGRGFVSLLSKFNVALVLVFSLALIPAGWVSRTLLQRSARTQVIQNARIMMETAMAMRGYTIKQIKPLLNSRLKEQFLPQTVPAYSATEVFNYLRQSNPEYTYKEATLNPSNPRDRAVDWEADVITQFQKNAGLNEIIGERQTVEGPSLFLSHPIRITDPRCLSCHRTPEEAPPSLVRFYGPSNGFGWKLNEIVGAQIVSVPTSIPVSMANQAFRTLLASLAGVFVVTLLVLNLLLRYSVTRPLTRLATIADQVSHGDMEAPDLDLKGHDEVARLAGAFGRMRISLKKALAMLDET